MWNLPNILTMLRIVLIPIFVAVFYVDEPWAPYAAAAVFGIAALTDWLDGYLARRLQQTSPLGAFLDPVADKLMVAVSLVVLLQVDPRVLIALPVMVIIGREITVSALREWMAEIGARAAVAVSKLGKVKTTAQMISIVLLILRDSVFGPWVYDIGVALLYVAATLTLWSMVLYLDAAWPSLSGKVDASQAKSD
ncbi:CDP-diacylglycerol--glycerol-3-phosphate 3-phosphatidyltransferase [Thiorhodococcus mannitoliphagus]|uniref:CDP-diacylglycerol--glycerol-3-phosphate 3-phosphatidyltransferase n=1 Tax=Thiorhodococcus mannitoliphagus TaxID=329406 RepID=A0A6P1DV71_9GAMM|nr:CDP-diacylglycerol--glycerol-3-phosphate 3-phosphatidyltransferase [Thiorhodococcus mannitoliphagus]NEX20586.1 CDP-diacylglycerol--glycerol-3-phosphate 3-phosphatidyltransferase [Thiorhodococcus mannitoliphagus]